MAVFVDMKKAFDTVCHTILIERIMDLGLHQNNVSWLSKVTVLIVICYQVSPFVRLGLLCASSESFCQVNSTTEVPHNLNPQGRTIHPYSV